MRHLDYERVGNEFNEALTHAGIETATFPARGPSGDYEDSEFILWATPAERLNDARRFVERMKREGGVPVEHVIEETNHRIGKIKRGEKVKDEKRE